MARNVWTSAVIGTVPSGQNLMLTPVGLDTWVSPEDWSIPVYSYSTSGKLCHLLYNENAWSFVASGRWKRFGNSAKVEAEIKDSSSSRFPYRGNVYSSTSTTEWVLPTNFNTAKAQPGEFLLRNSMLPAPGLDGHMAAYVGTSAVLETYATIRLSSGDVVALSYSVSDPGSQCDGYQNGQTASMLPCYSGLITDAEVRRGRIEHALAITVPADLLKPEIEYPAYAFDRGALTEKPPYRGALPMGARLAIPGAAPEMRTAEGRTIAAAMKRYGAIVVDRGGSGISIRVRRNTSSPVARLRRWDADLQQDLYDIFWTLQLAY